MEDNQGDQCSNPSGDTTPVNTGSSTPVLYEDTPREAEPVPKVLIDMFDNGAKFSRVPEFTWSVKKDGKSAKLRKELSVSFSVDTVVSSQEILVGFDAAGIDIDSVTSVQRRASNNTWVVAFKSPEAKNAALGVSCVSIAGCTVLLGDCENRLQLVKIYEAPPEMPDTVIIGRLSRYGKVFSFRRDKVADSIYNGIRTARMRVNKVIPSSLYIAGEPLRIWYPTQPKMCRRCCSEDHLVKDCRSVRCFNCEAPGHVSTECPSPPLCSICLEEDHAANLCPFLLFSANVIENPGNSSYADVAGTLTGKAGGTSSYAGVASRSPEQAEAIKAARAATGSGPTPRASAEMAVSDKKQSKSTHSKKPSSQKSSSKSQQQKEESDGEGDRDRERERERERERDRERSKRDRDRDRDRRRERHHSSDHHRERDRSDYRRKEKDDRSSDDDESDMEWVQVKRKHRSRR